MPRSVSRTQAQPGPSGLVRHLYARPGFLIWRAHHIAVSIFTEQCGALGITSPQYGALCVIIELPGIDQTGIARLAGQDRFTAALVLSNLRKRGLILRKKGESDRRRHCFRISRRGLALFRRAQQYLDRGRARLLSPFTPREARAFSALLTRLIVTLNKESRAPIDEDALLGARPPLPRAGKKAR
jgi:DNA-binding MarR family transcriptional regulator